MTRDEGFAEEFRSVFEGEFPRLFRYVSRMTGDRSAAADIAQEAFVRLYERGSLPDDVRAWLVTVAHNQVRDAHRVGRRRAELLGERGDRLRPVVDPSPEAAAASSEKRARVREALEDLCERDRRALVLRHEGYTYREIARALDYPVTGVGKLLVRAGRAFRRAFEERRGLASD